MIFLLFGYISAVLSIIMVLPYIRDIFQLKTKPERASWLIWTVLTSIAFFSQWAKGATDSLWLSAGQTIGVFIVLLLSIKYGVGGLTKRGMVALSIAGLGVVLWYFTREPLYALLLVIAVDGIGSVLTVMKAYKDPLSETNSTFMISALSGIFGVLAVGSFNIILLLYPLYIVAANAAIVAAILCGKKRG